MINKLEEQCKNDTEELKVQNNLAENKPVKSK